MQLHNTGEQDLRYRLLTDIVNSFYFDPATLITLMLDLKARNKLTDHRKGTREARFAGVDYDAITRPVPKLSL